MRIWMAAIAVLALGASAARAQDCTLKQYDSLPMEVSPENLLLPVTFGTVPKKMVFRLDIAANAITADFAKEQDMYFTSLPPRVNFQRNGQRIMDTAHASKVQLGNLNLDRMEFLVLKPLRPSGVVVGEIGTHMFEKMDMELDIANAKLNLFSQDHCPGKAVYWTKGAFAQLPMKSPGELGYVRAEVMLDDKPITVGLSTVGRSRIGMNAMRRLFNVDATSPGLVPVDQDLLGNKFYRYAFKTLTADGLTITNPDILVYDEEPRPECKDRLHFEFPDPEPLHSTERERLVRCFGGEDAVLGLSVLRKLHLYISSKEKIVYLTSAGAK